MKLLRILGSMTLAVTSIAAAERRPEISASLGYRGGGSLDATSSGREGADADAAPSWGLSVGWWVRSDAWVEVLFDRQTLEFEPAPGSGIDRFDMNVDYLQLGSAYEPPRKGGRPYVTAALGLSRYGSDPGSVSASTGLSGSIGAGLEVPVGRKVLLRFEARGWATITSSSAEVTCGPGCSFRFSGDGWWQLGSRVAVAYLFGGTTGKSSSSTGGRISHAQSFRQPNSSERKIPCIVGHEKRCIDARVRLPLDFESRNESMPGGTGLAALIRDTCSIPEPSGRVDACRFGEPGESTLVHVGRNRTLER